MESEKIKANWFKATYIIMADNWQIAEQEIFIAGKQIFQDFKTEISDTNVCGHPIGGQRDVCLC